MLVRGAEFIDQRLIYGLVDPREPERVRYVGQTTRTPIFRYAGHISLPKGYEPSLRCAWVAELREAGVYPDMVLLEKVAKSVDLDDRELHWIAALKAIGQADTNAPLPRWYVDGKPRPPMPWQDERRAARRAAR